MVTILRRHSPLFAWLALVVLTLLSLAAGEWLRELPWLPLLVAALIWIKGTLVAQHFIEADEAHAYIGWILRIFIGFAPVALVLTAYFGPRFVRWLSG